MFLGVLKSPTLETSDLGTLGTETGHHWLEPVLLLAAVEQLGSYARSFFNESAVHLPEKETATQ